MQAANLEGGRMRLRTWRAGRSDWRVQALSIFSLSVAFVCLASALLVVTNLAAVRDRWSRAGRATVYLRDSASETEVADLQRALEATPGVTRARHVSAAEARREVVSEGADSMLAALPPNAFPASIEVSFENDLSDDDLASMAVKLRVLPAVESVETYARWTERLSALLGGGVTASTCLALIVLCAVVSVIGSTMRLLLHRRKIEVEVLKLVGATDGFVRRPFVLEGATQGAAGAGGALLVLGVLFLMVRGRFDQELVSLLGVAPSFLPVPVALGMVALGGALGAITALLTLRRMAAV
ncbi:cell division protein FtsX [Chondromyces apiculatus]|uniref:Cell division protein FtsX n=1 Tax=Chondromyces apiculatus DSM 436 TaxID=1192034 RepID=A0A017TBK8_9BACT|nr:permease-like cell division protein FtsX [Chondromyces apiculatus]EYF06668.1 Cell division protein FtsX [Chondromyces apiculatus DSM 436]